MNKIRNIIVALGVFAMMIGSGFAMDTNPPTEPVKTTVETEVVTDNLEKTTFLNEGYGYYDDVLEKCVLLSEGTLGPDCSTVNPGTICTEDINNIPHTLYFMSRISANDPWICGLPLRKP